MLSFPTQGEARDAPHYIAPAVVAFLLTPNGGLIRMIPQSTQLVIEVDPVPDPAVLADAEIAIGAMLIEVQALLAEIGPPDLPRFTLKKEDNALVIRAQAPALDLGRKTVLFGKIDRTPVQWPLQRGLLHLTTLAERRLEASLPAAEFDRIWNLLYGGLALPVDGPDHCPPCGPPGPNTPGPTGPPIGNPPQITSFSLDGHTSSPHRILADESVFVHWRVNPNGPTTTIDLEENGTLIAQGLPAIGSHVVNNPQSGTYTLRATYPAGDVISEMDLEVLDLPPDPGTPGPHPVGIHDVFGPSPAVVNPQVVAPGEGFFNITTPASPGIPVLTRGWRARIFHPSASTGTVTITPPGGPFPVVFFCHGRWNFPDSPNNYRNITFLADHLVSRGYIFISVDCSQVDDYGIPNTPQRAALFGAAVNHLVGLHEDPAWPLHGQFDLNNIMLSGHSRGGETVKWFASDNRTRPPAEQLNVKGIATLAPSFNNEYRDTDEPLLVLYGSRDGDLYFGSPVGIFDRADTYKKLVYIYGANHFHWTDDRSLFGDIADITREQAHKFARSYVTAFLEFGLRANEACGILLKRHRGLGNIDNIDYYGIFNDPSSRTIHDFDPSGTPLSPNNLFEPVTPSGGSFAKEQLPRLFYPVLIAHQTSTLAARYNGGTAPVIEELLTPGGGYSDYTHLAVKVLQVLDDSENSSGGTRDFSIELEDFSGQLARVAASHDFAIPESHRAPGGTSNALNKGLYVSIRLPLRAFLEANDQLNITDLAAVRLIFDRSSSGSFLLDDLQFTD